MATNFSPSSGSYVLNTFPSIVMFGMKGFYISASGAIQGHYGPLVLYLYRTLMPYVLKKSKASAINNLYSKLLQVN